ncbi:hypothetical protein EDD17DRAFT_1802937 [Pisolithus thermaeus]|nr:hypothetical protein EDD17DRAFT_1802937 [Pisolithus thermaeus]
MAPQREMNLRVKGSSNGPPSAAGSSRHSSWLWLAPLSARNRFTQVSVALAPLALPDPLPKRAFIDSRQLLHPALWSDISWDTTEAFYRSSVRQQAQPQCRGIVAPFLTPLKTRGLSISGAASSPKTPTATGSHSGLEVLLPSTDQGGLAQVSQRVRTTPNEGGKLEQKINGPRNLWFTADTCTLEHAHPRTESGGLEERSSPPTYAEKKERTLPSAL